MSDIQVPTTFPFGGSGNESRKYTYELLDFAGDADAIARGWRRLEQGTNFIRGRHKRHWPGMNINSLLYAGGASPLASFARIQLGPDAGSMIFKLWMETCVDLYDFTISESTGANSVTVSLPGTPSAKNILVVAELELTGAGSGMTTLTIAGDNGTANHPILKTVGWSVAEERSY